MSRTILTLVFLLTVLAAPVVGQPAEGRKFALLVGVRDYSAGGGELDNLRYTENDVESLGKLLREQGGYERTVILTASRGKSERELLPTAANIQQQFADLLKELRKGDTMLVGLSGHGLQLEKLGKRESFFCPLDARPSREANLIGLRELYDRLDASRAGVKLLLVDACRNDFRGGGASTSSNGGGGKDFVPPTPPRGVAALFSCSRGQKSFESSKSEHGIFFHHVIEGLKGAAADRRGEVTLYTLIDYLQGEVPKQVSKEINPFAEQMPNLVGDVSGRIALTRVKPGDVPPPPPREDPLPLPSDPRFRFPPTPPVIVKPSPERPPPGEKVESKWPPMKSFTNTFDMVLVGIPSGSFLMGSSKEEVYRQNDETEHDVALTRPFYLGAYEITQKQYRVVMGSNPSYHSVGGEGRTRVRGMDTDDFPVERVSWQDAMTFCQRLTDRDRKLPNGWHYRLPTEAEWEYACRANASPKTVFHYGNDLVAAKANFNGLYPYGGAPRDVKFFAHPIKVGSYKANAWGLYDMHGNVGEWCLDVRGEYGTLPVRDPFGPKTGKDNLSRGGAWVDSSWGCRSADRNKDAWANRNVGTVGFRVALVPGGKAP